MNKHELMENLAAIEHSRWGDWMEHLFSRGTFLPDGNFVIDKEDVNRWCRQVAMSYDQLSEEEKDSDRREVKRYWHLIIE